MLISVEMNKLLDLVTSFHLDRALDDFESNSTEERLIFKNKESAGYFHFKLEIEIPKFNSKFSIQNKNNIIIIKYEKYKVRCFN